MSDGVCKSCGDELSGELLSFFLSCIDPSGI